MQEMLKVDAMKSVYKSAPETIVKIDLTKSAYENDMIHNTFIFVTQSKVETLSLNSHLVHQCVGTNGYILGTRFEPGSPRRTHGSRPRPILNSTRQAAEQIRSLDCQADPSRTYAAAPIKHPRKALRAHPLVAPKPMNLRIANQHFDIGSRFRQEGGCLQGALSTSYDENFLAAEFVKIPVLGRVGYQR